MISELAKLLLRWLLIVTVLLLVLIIFFRELFIQMEELMMLDLTLSELSILALFVKPGHQLLLLFICSKYV